MEILLLDDGKEQLNKICADLIPYMQEVIKPAIIDYLKDHPKLKTLELPKYLKTELSLEDDCSEKIIPALCA